MSKKQREIEELLSDETFLSWYFQTDLSSIRQWEEWMALDDRNRDRAQEAASLLGSLRLEEKELAPGQLTAAIKRLMDHRKLLDPNSRSLIRLLKPWMAAACLLLIAVGYYGYHWWGRGRTSFYAAYGEVKIDSLPDGTAVTVNADTRLSYPTNWKKEEDREVWLSGEAFFHVSKTPLKTKFIVHTPHFDIIVTGTRFNAVSRLDKSNIFLEEGSVLLQERDGEQRNILPGDFVEYKEGGLYKRTIKSDSLTAWKERKLVFEGIPLHELLAIIHEHYGVVILPADEATGYKTISGVLPNDNLDILLQALEATGDFKVIHEKNRILIKSR